MTHFAIFVAAVQTSGFQANQKSKIGVCTSRVVVFTIPLGGNRKKLTDKSKPSQSKSKTARASSGYAIKTYPECKDALNVFNIASLYFNK